MASVPENAMLVTADVVELYPSIPNDVGLKEQALTKKASPC